MWIYGFNPVIEAIKAGRDIKEVYVSSGRHEKLFVLRKEAESRGIALKTVDTTFFNERFPKGHQGIAAKVSEKEYTDFYALLDIPETRSEAPFFLILDCIEDPGNVGAILRSADAAGVHGVVIQEHRSAGLGPVVSKASAGAVEYVPVSRVSNIKHAISEMKERGITIIGAESGSDKMPWDIDFSLPAAIVIGSEGKGLRKTVAEKCDFIVSIPMNGSLNSLNASVASAVLMFEVLRQRTRKK